MTAEQLLAAAGYKIVSRIEFDAASDIPAGMRKVADGVLAKWGGDFICYDPAGGDDGWLIIDDNRETVIGETVEHLGRHEAETKPPAQASLF